MSRNKWSHLTYDEQLHVYREHSFQHKSISWIWKEYGLSSSAVKRIIKMFKLNVDRSEIYTNVRCRGLIKRQLVQNIIKRFINSNDRHFQLWTSKIMWNWNSGCGFHYIKLEALWKRDWDLVIRKEIEGQ